MCRSTVALSTALLIACSAGPTAETGTSSASPRPQLEIEFPALRWVPPDAAFVIVTKRLGDAATVAREIAMPVLIGLNLDDESLGRMVAETAGVDLLSPEGLKAAGLDQNSGAAAFAHGGGMIFVVAVADQDALRAFLETQRSREGVSVTVHRDHEVTTLSQPSGDKTSWVVLGDWVLMRTAPEMSGAAWLDPLLEASNGESFAASAVFGKARARAEKRMGTASPGVLLVGRTGALAREFSALLPDDVAPCAGNIARAAPRFFGYASAGWEAGKGGLEFALSKGARASLEEAIGPSPGGGLLGLRKGHGLSASFALSFEWIHQVRQASGCPALSRPIDDPAAVMGWRPPPSGYHLVLSALDLDRMQGEGAMVLTIRNRAFLDRQLDSIPGRSLFDRSKTVGGVKVRRVSIPGYDPIFYRITGDRLSVASNRDRMAQVVADGSGPKGKAREIAFLRIEPARFRRLGDLMSDLYARMGYRSTLGADRQAQRLRRYEWAELALELRGRTLLLRADMKLKP